MFNPNMVYPISGLLEHFISEIHAENRRKHEQKIKELEIIANSSLRDAYAQQLLLDKFLGPVEKAQHKLQNIAKAAQRLAEKFNYYHKDHGASQEEARAIAEQLRVLAIKVTEVDSLYDLKVVYGGASYFAHQMSKFRHKERKYSLEYGIRTKILDPLNDCIATEKNFQRRLEAMAEK